MNKILLPILLFYSLCSPIYCQSELPSKPISHITWEVPGMQPPSNNIMFVIDTSGSMDGRRVQSAIQKAMQIAEAPLDDLQIAIISFGSEIIRWEGTDDIDPRTKKPLSRKQWSIMPSQDNLNAAYQWMQNNRDSGGTNIKSAVAHAFETCLRGKEKVKNLSIIIISDGDFYPMDYPQLKKMIIKYQQNRVNLNLPPAALGFFGIDVKSDDDKQIKSLLGKYIEDSNRGYWKPVLGVLGYCRLIYLKEDEEE